MAARMWTRGKEKVWIRERGWQLREVLWSKTRETKGRAGLLQEKLEIQGGIPKWDLPLAGRVPGTWPREERRLKDRRQEKGHVSTRLSSTRWARHHLWHLYLINWSSCPPLARAGCCGVEGITACSLSGHSIVAACTLIAWGSQEGRIAP